MEVHADLRCIPQGRGLKKLANVWKRVVSSAPKVGPTAALYQGRSISDTVAVARHLSTHWYVVSAGLGLIREDQIVPSYDCSVASGSELSKRLESLQATSADWWTALNASHPHPLSQLIAQGPTFLALPSSYLGMVSQDLLKVSNSAAEHLRIFTSSAGAGIVPDSLAQCVMPYDDRLESMPSYSGTRADFAQRALRHFVLKLDASKLTRDESRAKVTNALSRLPFPSRIQGTRLSDDEIRRTLMIQWNRHEGRSARLLRYLRDEAGISCEQKRFGRIWRSLAAEMQVRS